MTDICTRPGCGIQHKGRGYCPNCFAEIRTRAADPETEQRPRFSDRHLAQITRDRDRANVILAHIVESLDTPEDTAWEHLPKAVCDIRARVVELETENRSLRGAVDGAVDATGKFWADRVAELEAWQSRAFQQARRAADDTDRWNALWLATDGKSTELADMIDAILDQRDIARAEAGRANGEAGALHARAMELRAQVAARDKRIAELEAASDRVRDVHQPIEALNVRYPGGRLTEVCTGCGTDDGNWQTYPCPTIRALNDPRPVPMLREVTE